MSRESGKGRPDFSICAKELFKYFHSWAVFPNLFGNHRPIVTSLKFDIPKLPKCRFRTKNVRMKKFTTLLKISFSANQINLRSITSILEMDRELNILQNKIKESGKMPFK